MALSQSEIDIIATQILLDAKAALASLKSFNESVTDSQQRLQSLKGIVASAAQQMNGDFKKAEMAVKRFSGSITGIKAEEVKIATNLAANEFQKIGQVGENSFGRIFNSVNALRIALGALVSMILFQVIQAFGKMAREALKGLTEIEAATFNLVNAEKRLSEQGIEIDVKGLDEIIQKIQMLDPMLSKFQATELVSSITTKVAPALRLGKDEIESLATSITVLSVRNQALGKSFEEVESQVITGLLSGRVTSGINQLGVKITDQIVQEEALRLGLVATTEAYKSLNAQEKERIDALSIISILEKNTAQEAQNLPAFLQTASGLIGVARAEFSDLLTGLGQKFAPLLKEIFRGAITFLERMNRSLTENEDAWNALVSILTVGAKMISILINGFLELSLAIGKVGAKIYEVLGALPIFGDAVKKLFPEQAFPDTPTGQFIPDISGQVDKESSETEKSLEKLQDIMRENAQKLEDIEQDYQRKIQDINLDYAQKLEDIARDSAQKREDALIDYNQKVEDINRDAAEKVAEAQEDYRRRELEREAEYQNRLRELKDKFLFDLEDALRERDARQVLRLIRQYNLDKKNLEERRKLEQEQAKIDLQNKLADIERERVLKLEAARREYEEKLKEIQIGEQRAREEANRWRQRQLQDARIWYERQLTDQREYLKRKLADLAAAYAQELSMANQFWQKLNTLQASALGRTAIKPPSFNPPSSTQNPLGGIGSGLYNPYDIRTIYKQLGIPGFAEGGTVVARKPTLALFGEKGMEAATFTPLNRNGRDVNKVFGDRSGIGSEAGGFLNLRIALSDGLVADVVNESLNQVATHIEQMRRAERL